MAKNSREQIKEDENKILQELIKNANKSVNEIAKNCGFSRQKVWRIIKNLEKNNTIWGYVAVIDEEKQNRKEYMVMIKRTNKPTSEQLIEKIIGRELSDKLKKEKIELETSIYTNGFYDWVICFVANDIKQAKRFVDELNELFEGYIDEIVLLEKMFAVEKCGIMNPEIDNFREFFALG